MGVFAETSGMSLGEKQDICGVYPDVLDKMNEARESQRAREERDRKERHAEGERRIEKILQERKVLEEERRHRQQEEREAFDKQQAEVIRKNEERGALLHQANLIKRRARWVRKAEAAVRSCESSVGLAQEQLDSFVSPEARTEYLKKRPGIRGSVVQRGHDCNLKKAETALQFSQSFLEGTQHLQKRTFGR